MKIDIRSRIGFPSLIISFFLIQAIASMHDGGCTLQIGKKINNKEGYRRLVTAELPEKCKDSDIVTVDIEDVGTIRSFKKVRRISPRNRSISKSKYTSWYGEEQDGSTFNFIQDEKGSMTGSIIDATNHTVMQISQQNGSFVVTTTKSSEFPPEGEPKQDLVKQYAGSTDKLQETSQNNAPRQNQSPLDLYDDSGGNLDVMVVWTKTAECRAYGLSAGCTLTTQTKANMEALINLAVVETNTAYEESGIQTELLLVEAYRHPTYVENSFDTTLADIQKGFIPGVHANRATHGADIVSMIIHDDEYCGLGYVGPDPDLMFSITSWSCATGYYSFGHEIGHNLGLNHDRGSEGDCNSGGYNYGYRDPNARFRTILAYDCVNTQCDNNVGGGCTRIGRFSNQYNTYNGLALGGSSENNAKAINDVRVEVASYFTHVSSESPTAPTPTGSPPTPTQSSGTCDSKELDVLISLTTDAFPSETSWIVMSAYGEEATSDVFTGKDTAYNERMCLDASRCYSFIINDRYGDGLTSAGAKFKLKVDDSVVLKSTRDPFVSLNASFGRCECDGDELEVGLAITTDQFPSENSWKIKQRNDIVLQSIEFKYPTTNYNTIACLNPSRCYTFNIKDEYGDGINSDGNFDFKVNNEILLSNSEDEFDSRSVDFGKCGAGTGAGAAACNDSPLRFKIEKSGNMISRDCSWVGNKDTKNRCLLGGVSTMCPETCGVCTNCIDGNARFKVLSNGNMIARSCTWVSNKQTAERCDLPGIIDTCRSTCNSC